MNTLIFGLVPGVLTKTHRIFDVLKQCQADELATLTATLPLSTDAPAMLVKLVKENPPSIVLGIAPVQWSHELETEPELSNAIRVENFALNITDADADEEASPLIAEGPPGYQSLCDPSLIVSNLLAAGHQAVTSYFPGTSASNACYYQLLHLMNTQQTSARCLLLHLPCDMIGPDQWREHADNNAWSHAALLNAVQQAMDQLASQAKH